MGQNKAINAIQWLLEGKVEKTNQIGNYKEKNEHKGGENERKGSFHMFGQRQGVLCHFINETSDRGISELGK